MANFKREQKELEKKIEKLQNKHRKYKKRVKNWEKKIAEGKMQKNGAVWQD